MIRPDKPGGGNPQHLSNVLDFEDRWERLIRAARLNGNSTWPYEAARIRDRRRAGR